MENGEWRMGNGEWGMGNFRNGGGWFCSLNNSCSTLIGKIMAQVKNAIPIGYYAAKESTGVQDWKFGATGLADLKPAPVTFWDRQHQYNQLDVHPMSCTIFASIGAISDLTNYRFSTPQLTQMVLAARKVGFADDGWFVNAAVDFVRGWWQREKQGTMMSYRVNLASAEVAQVLQKGYSIVTGYRGNSQYNDDVGADGQLDMIEFGETNYGHAIRIVQDQAKPDQARVVVDNYVNYNSFNQYRIKIADLAQLVQKGVFFNDGYIFVNTMNNRFVDVPRTDKTEWYYSCVEWAAKEGLMSGYEDGTFRPTDPINRAQMAVLMKKLYDKLAEEPKST
jgi:S-layer homology domain